MHDTKPERDAACVERTIRTAREAQHVASRITEQLEGLIVLCEADSLTGELRRRIIASLVDLRRIARELGIDPAR